MESIEKRSDKLRESIEKRSDKLRESIEKRSDKLRELIGDTKPDLDLPQKDSKKALKVWYDLGIVALSDHSYTIYTQTPTSHSKSFKSVYEYLDYVATNKNHGNHKAILSFLVEMELL